MEVRDAVDNLSLIASYVSEITRFKTSLCHLLQNNPSNKYYGHTMRSEGDKLDKDSNIVAIRGSRSKDVKDWLKMTTNDAAKLTSFMSRYPSVFYFRFKTYWLFGSFNSFYHADE